MTDEDVGKETAQARPISPYLRVTVRIFAAVPGYSDLHPATCWECDRGKKNDSQILLNDLGVLLGIHLCLESLNLHTNGTQTFGKGSLHV